MVQLGYLSSFDDSRSYRLALSGNVHDRLNFSDRGALKLLILKKHINCSGIIGIQLIVEGFVLLSKAHRSAT